MPRSSMNPFAVTLMEEYVFNFDEITTSPNLTLLLKPPQNPTQNTALGFRIVTVESLFAWSRRDPW